MEKGVVLHPNKTISVIMAAYNASRTVGTTIQNLFNQSYKNLEIIIVNDGSTDETPRIVKEYQNRYSNIKLVNLEENSGPFKARVAGVDHATGEYIHFIDADDYLSIDFYRTTLTKAIETQADIVIGSIVLDFKNQGYIRDYPLINDLPFASLSGEDTFKVFMEQGGLNFIYHMNSTKLYRKELWDNARPHYDQVKKHLIMADDVAMNIPLWYFAEKIERTPTATLFYVKDDNDSATSNYQISSKKMYKNIEDLNTVFTFFEDFLTENKVIDTYKDSFNQWKRAFTRVYYRNISEAGFNKDEEKDLLEDLFSKVAPYSEEEHWLDTPYFHIHSTWRSGLEDIKKSLLQSDIQRVIFSSDSLLSEELTLTGQPSYAVRSTGLELAQLAHFLEKDILIDTPSPSVIQKLKTSPLSSLHIDKAEGSHYGPGVMLISLPKPLDIFIERGLDRPFHYTYKNSATDPMASVIKCIANIYFDNPYVSTFDTSAFDGKPSLIGVYSLGLCASIPSGGAASGKAYNDLLKIVFQNPPLLDPYEKSLTRGILTGIKTFTGRMRLVNGPDLSKLGSTEVNSQAAIGLAFYTRVWVDRQLLTPLLYRYPTIIDKHSQSVHEPPSLGTKIKNVVNRSTLKVPFINSVLKKAYTSSKTIKKKVLR